MNFQFDFPLATKISHFDRFIKFLGLIFGLLGFGLAVPTVKIHHDHNRAKDWAPHTATILAAEVAERQYEDEISYSVDVYYQYEWENWVYRGDRYWLYETQSHDYDEKKARVDALLAAKARKDDYPIFVNPDNPAESAIKNSAQRGTLIISAFLTSAFLIFGYIAFFHPGLVNRRDEEAAEHEP